MPLLPILGRLRLPGQPRFPAATGAQGATGLSSRINRTAHGLSASQRVVFSNILPSSGSGLDPTVVYYVLAAGLLLDSFEISETDGGTPLQLALALSANMQVVPETSSPSQAITITAATDLINAALHGFLAGDTVFFTALVGGTGLTESTTYYVLASGLTANAFKVSTTLAGTPVDITVDYSSGLLWRSAVYLPITDPANVMANGDLVAGWVGSWDDYIATGLYNSRYKVGVGGVGGLIGNGRTAALPYWTVSDDAGTPNLSFLNPGLRFAWNANNTTKRITSDAINVIPSRPYEVQVSGPYVHGGGTITLEVTVEWYKQDGTPSATPTTIAFTYVAAAASGVIGDGALTNNTALIAPSDAYLAKLRITAAETVAHDATNKFELLHSLLRHAWWATAGFERNSTVFDAAYPIRAIGSMQIGSSATTYGDAAMSASAGGYVQFGPAGGGVAGTDTRIERTAAKTLTASDSLGGALTLMDLLGAPIAGKKPVVNVYAANGTWTKPVNCQFILVEVIGGGAQGGGSTATAAGQGSTGGGGGGGGYARKVVDVATLSSNGTITVGAGGSTGGTGAAGQNGGLSSFAATGVTTIQGNGGTGGGAPGVSAVSGIFGNGGAGGTATGGDTNASGSDGTNGGLATGTPIAAGQGGASARGGGGRAAAGGNNAGTVGSPYGGGGGGATTSGAAGAARAGANGGIGVVVVTEFYGP